MCDPEESEREASSFNENKVMEFAGKEEKRTPPPSPEEDMFDMEETAEKLFFSDQDGAFPSLADFACLSSPSATSTLPRPSNSSPSSSSSFSSSSPWPFLLVPTETDAAATPASEDPFASIIDSAFDIVGDGLDLWETCIEEPVESKCEEKVGFLSGEEGCSSEDLAPVFLDWLKRNKDTITPEDLRSIKLKRSTIECASRRFGGGKQGRVQLLKLILTWVQNHHLKKRRRCSRATYQDLPNYPPPPPPQTATICNPNVDLYYNSWMPYTVEAEHSYPPAIPGCREEATAVSAPPYNYYNDQAFCAQPYQQGLSLPSTSSVIHYSQIPTTAPASASAPELYFQHLPVHYTGQMALATREARKKRMARHRKQPSLHHHRTQQPQHSQLQQSFDVEKDNSSNGFLLSADIPSSSSLTAVAAQEPFRPVLKHHPHRRISSPGERRREGIKSENNYKFLLRKVLKQSDVGSLGRIVLPKKEAEIHLPALDTRDGISIDMEDMGASRVWNMRYRFWPNNKSRMYVLENTGDFVRSNGLQEGDFIVIYSDVKCEKYMIRGVKVRQSMDMLKGSSINRSSSKKENGSSTIDKKGKSHLC